MILAHPPKKPAAILDFTKQLFRLKKCLSSKQNNIYTCGITYYKVHKKIKFIFQCSVSFCVVNSKARCWTKAWLVCTIPTLVLAFFSFFVAGAHNASLLWILLALCWGDELWKVATRETISSCRGRKLGTRFSKQKINAFKLESQQWLFSTLLPVKNVRIK